MPQRTNEFQALISCIAAALAPSSATVTESALILEAGVSSPILREVDILVELEAGLTTVRVGIECRNRSRKDDIQWIDEIIGKYRHLPVDQCVAVSRSGFSKSAREKAALCNIQLLSFEEAVGDEWAQRFAKLIIDKIELRFLPGPLYVCIAEGQPIMLSPADWIIWHKINRGRTVDVHSSTAQEFFATIDAAFLDWVKDELKLDPVKYFQMMIDKDDTSILDCRIPVSDLTVRFASGGEFPVTRLGVYLRVATLREELEVERHLVGDRAFVTSAILDGLPTGRRETIHVVQIGAPMRKQS